MPWSIPTRPNEALFDPGSLSEIFAFEMAVALLGPKVTSKVSSANAEPERLASPSETGASA